MSKWIAVWLALDFTLLLVWAVLGTVCDVVRETPRATDRAEVLKLRSQVAAYEAELQRTDEDLAVALREAGRARAEVDLLIHDREDHL